MRIVLSMRALVAVLLVGIVGAVAFAPAAGAATRPPMPRHAWLDVATTTTATIRWTAVRNATGYEIRRGGVPIGRVSGTSALVTQLTPSSFANLQVVTLRGTLASVPSDPIPAVTRASTACTHYVSSTRGSDGAAGTRTSPWRTIGRLVDAWQPGWVGCLEGSFAEDVSIMRGGAATSQVTLRNVPGTRASLRGRLWVARGADHVVVAHLRLDGRALKDTARDSLPSPTINARGTMLLDNDITNHGTRVCAVVGSIRGYGTAVLPTIAYNRIHGCGRRGANTHHGIYVESARNARIVHNAIFDNADRGIQLYPDAQRSLIVGNLVDGNGTGIIFSGAEGYRSSRNMVVRNVLSGAQLRNNLEHYWEQGAGSGNFAARNCLGGARQGDVALPPVGYALRDNSSGRLAFRDRARDDLRTVPGSGCRAWLLSRMLPLRRTST